MADLLSGARWECCATLPGLVAGPAELGDPNLAWVPASVPGTAAGARRDAPQCDAWEPADPDRFDWWFRCRFDGPTTRVDSYLLEFEGLATLAEVWFNGVSVLHSENMFVPHSLPVGVAAGNNEVVVACRALAPRLGERRPRPRWKTQLADHQNLRWFRTTLLGRQPGWTECPAPVGPWRPVRLRRRNPVEIAGRRVVARCDDDGPGGDVHVELELALEGPVEAIAHEATLRLGSVTAPLTIRSRPEGGPQPGTGTGLVAIGRVQLPEVERWWPHTHGSQPRYPLSAEIGGQRIDLGHVGFKTVVLDRRDGGFRLSVNGVEVFCRGACWWPIEPVSLVASDDDLRLTLELVRRANMNMLRIPGGTLYEDERFWDLCDELGIMVWQDCMIGYLDPPDDEDFVAGLLVELDAVFGALGGRSALTLVCGGQEIGEQAAMFGLPRDRWVFPLQNEVIPKTMERLHPGIPYVPDSPSGGNPPFRVDQGDCHYFGVGSYLRDLGDARRSQARFVSEGLAFAIPPERPTVDEACGGAVRAGHDPRWKAALHHDTGRSWDLEDFRDYYVGKLFDVDPHLLRYHDAERALDLGRAVVAEIMGAVTSEWRSPEHPCAGALVIALRDLSSGAGFGVIDALGRPKAPWYALARAFAPVALLFADEGLNGLRAHLVNDTDRPFIGTLRVDLYARGELRVERAEHQVSVAARGSEAVEVSDLFDGFRDLSYAYRFAPPGADVVVGTLLGAGGGSGADVAEGDPRGEAISEAFYLVDGPGRRLEPDVGLVATASAGADAAWFLAVSTTRFAQRVQIEVPGYTPDDSWFHLAPGTTRVVRLHPAGATGPPAGVVRALNSEVTARVSREG